MEAAMNCNSKNMGNHFLVRISGSIESNHDIPHLVSLGTDLIQNGLIPVVLDFSHSDFIVSRICGVIATLCAIAHQDGKQVIVVMPDTHPAREALRSTSIDKKVPVLPSIGTLKMRLAA